LTKQKDELEGVGFHYLTARKLGLYTGVDIAMGSEEAVIHFQVDRVCLS